VARQKLPLTRIWQDDPNHISRNILAELTLYAKDKQFYPLQRTLFRMMAYPSFNPVTLKPEEPRYPDLQLNLYDYWFARLVEEGYIEIDQPTRAIRCARLEIVDKIG
jgi:hypothetical protein